MGLRSALVDRARLVERVASPVRINKRTTFTNVTEPWFKARLQMPSAPETAEAAGGKTRNEVRPSMLFDWRDSEGNAVVLTTEKVVEVDSKELGRFYFRPDADPEPLRKKRRVIGFEVPLRRVEEHDFEPTVPPEAVSASTAMPQESR
jgi:hypothetical protein